MGRQDYETETLIPTIGGGFDVTHSLRGDGFDAGEDGTGRGTPLVPIAFSAKDYGADAGDLAPTLRAGGHTNSHANAGVMPAIAFGWQNSSQQGASASASASNTPTLDKSKVPAIGFDLAQITSKVNRNRAEDGLPQPPIVAGGSPHVASTMQVRRLTPRECERLQGFPSSREIVKIDICLDRQNGTAVAGLSCLRWLENASPADGQRYPQNAGIAASSFSILRAGQEPLAALRVRMQSVDELLEIRSHGRLIWCASNAGASNEFRLPTLSGSIAADLAPQGRVLALAVRNGKAGSPLSIRLSLRGRNGEVSAPQFGDGSAGFANAARTAATPERFTTSILGALAPTCDSPTAIWLCSALAVISGCIPSETLPERFSLELDLETPYTLVQHRNKPAADGPRYKALGNSMAVPCMRWLGERIQMVQEIYDAQNG